MSPRKLVAYSTAVGVSIIVIAISLGISIVIINYAVGGM